MSLMNQNDEVIERLRDYLRIPSVHPDADYSGCVTFLKNQANSLGLPFSVFEFVENKPIVVITWGGLQPEVPAILLNSHMDVVPVYEDKWTHPPFEAVVSDDGFIYARGVQDMKGVGMMHLEAVRRLKSAGVRLKRTIHLSFVPDEEIGGSDGMRVFSESTEFEKLNIGFALDESLPNPGSAYVAFNGERTSRQIKITCSGTPGHGALLDNDTAGVKLHYIIDKFMTLRKGEKRKLDAGKPLGEVLTINLTQLEGGVQINVLPESLSVSFDIRIPPNLDHQDLENTISRWCAEAGDGVSFEYYVRNPQIDSTNIDESVPFWTAMEGAIKEMNKEVNCIICPGATDARFVRRRGIPAIGFSAIANTPLLLHAHDERMHVDVYRNGIDIIEKVVVAVANV